VIALDLVGHCRKCIIGNNLQKDLITPSYTFQIYIMISTSQYDCMNLKSNNVKTNVNVHCVG
jgi:capsular polysaccharide biosynthesis protein